MKFDYLFVTFSNFANPGTATVFRSDGSVVDIGLTPGHDFFSGITIFLGTLGKEGWELVLHPNPTQGRPFEFIFKKQITQAAEKADDAL